MQTEIEAKFLDIKKETIRKKLLGLGAKMIKPEILMKRKTYDFPDLRLEKIQAWIRIRDEGDKITLSYKRLLDRSLHGTKEATVTVDDFEIAGQIIESLGLHCMSYQETKREEWQLDDCEITIDTWPWIPSFVEIEAPNERVIKMTAKKLGFDWKQALHGSVETAYQKYYDVTEAEVDHWKEITFIPTPAWLESKRK